MKFELNKNQVKMYEEWFSKHKEECSCDVGAIGGRLSFRFTPVSLGMIVSAECLCGKGIDLTESLNW